MIEKSVQRLLVRLLGGAFETEEYRIVMTDTSVLFRPKGQGEDVEIPYGDIERIVVNNHDLGIKTTHTVKFFQLGVDSKSKKM